MGILHLLVGNKNRTQVREFHEYRQLLAFGSILVAYMQVQNIQLRHYTTPLMVSQPPCIMEVIRTECRLEAVWNNALRFTNVSKWAATFKRGYETTSDVQRSGRPVNVECTNSPLHGSQQNMDSAGETDRNRHSEITILKTLQKGFYPHKVRRPFIDAQKWTQHAYLIRYQQKEENMPAIIVASVEFLATSYSAELKHRSTE